jgi:DNA-binding transcriptional MerR regulator
MGDVSNLRPWKKGQSGNPGGKPKLTPEQREATAKLRKYTPEVVDRLRQLCKSKDERVAHAACKTWLERGLPTDVVMRILEEREQRGEGGDLADDLRWLLRESCGEVG